MQKKLISIIIPCYNVEKYVDRCFDSLKNQTIGMDKMEIIFINDASTDGTLSKLSSYEEQYPEDILVINFEENQRQGTARNVALEYASAPYIGYVDADDWVEPTMFEKMTKLIAEYDCDFVECGWDYAKDINYRQPTKVWGKPGYMDLTKADNLYEFIGSKIALVSLWDKVFKKSFLTDNNIYCPEKILHEDIFFVYLAFTYAKSYYYTDEVLYHYFVNEQGTVRAKKNEHQLNKMPVTLGFFEECINRGLYNPSPKTDYEIVKKHSIEWMFLEKYYVYMLWEIFETFPELSYKKYLEMKETISRLIPDFAQNIYREFPGNEFDSFMIKLLEHNLTEESIYHLKDIMLKKFGARDAQDF